jgi:serine/threonine protein kinase
LADFGISKSNYLKLAANKTIITPASYTAPEIISRSKESISKVDIWALGVILYELVTCNHPFGHS